ncbi:hypothetical protein [Vulcanimicrobium alpinum]|uniref:hypothetical protein n=1 Tax=Vulcanimicrobium alpinum TaxID=3016050 RepID=UPI0038691096
MDGASGVLERVGMTNVVIRTSERGRVVLPNRILARYAVHSDAPKSAGFHAEM